MPSSSAIGVMMRIQCSRLAQISSSEYTRPCVSGICWASVSSNAVATAPPRMRSGGVRQTCEGIQL